jgi:hypothetical protein
MRKLGQEKRVRMRAGGRESQVNPVRITHAGQRTHWRGSVPGQIGTIIQPYARQRSSRTTGSRVPGR